MSNVVTAHPPPRVQRGCLEIQPVVPAGMDPLGARSQFVDIQTLPTWQQQLGEDGEETPLDHSDSLLSQQTFPSPFPFRPDINRKIILLWVTLVFLHIIADGWKSPFFKWSASSRARFKFHWLALLKSPPMFGKGI